MNGIAANVVGSRTLREAINISELVSIELIFF
jgi:hypothetical protein